MSTAGPQPLLPQQAPNLYRLITFPGFNLDRHDEMPHPDFVGLNMLSLLHIPTTLDNLRYKDPAIKNGASLFWLLAEGAARSDVYKIIIWRFINDITVEDYKDAPSSGEYQNISLFLLLLINKVLDFTPEFVQSYMPHLMEDLRKKTKKIVEHSETIDDKNITVLWWLCRYGYLPILWDAIKDQLNAEDLLVAPTSSSYPFKGISILHFLIDYHLPYFQYLWHKHKDKIPLTHLNVEFWEKLAIKDPKMFVDAWKHYQPSQVILKDQSVLSELAAQSGKDAAPFKMVFQHFKAKLTAKDFIYPLTRIAAVPIANVTRDQQHMIKDILQQIKGVITKTQLRMNVCKRQWLMDLVPLVEARNAFFQALSNLEGKEAPYTLTKADKENLSTLTEKAFTAGYKNAYFDLGLFLKSHNLAIDAALCFAKVPKEAAQFEEAIFEGYDLAVGCLIEESKATERDLSKMRQHFHLAVDFFIKFNIQDGIDKRLERIYNLFNFYAYFFKEEETLKDEAELRSLCFVNKGNWQASFSEKLTNRNAASPLVPEIAGENIPPVLFSQMRAAENSNKNSPASPKPQASPSEAKTLRVELG